MGKACPPRSATRQASDVRTRTWGYPSVKSALPGCFASGATLDELKEALVEAISMCLEDGVEGTPVARVDEMRVLVA
jgi:predicted RNase H-like HicB family nuclease